MTEKTFESYFSELQADMVSIALEYVDNEADYIYLYGSYEQGIASFNVFYKINNLIVRKHKLQEISTQYDVSSDRQFAMLDVGIDDLKKIYSLCEQYNQEMPTEMKMIYNVKTGEFNAKYSYGLTYTNTKDLTPEYLFDQWFEEVSQQKE